MSLFGASSTAAAQQPASLFGAGGASTGKAAGSSSLFGGSSSLQPSTSLFGGSAAPAASGQTASSGIATASLFGSGAESSSGTGGGLGLFGSSTSATAQPSLGISGSGTATADTKAGTAAPTSLFGNHSASLSSSVPLGAAAAAGGAAAPPSAQGAASSSGTGDLAGQPPAVGSSSLFGGGTTSLFQPAAAVASTGTENGPASSGKKSQAAAATSSSNTLFSGAAAVAAPTAGAAAGTSNLLGVSSAAPSAGASTSGLTARASKGPPAKAFLPSRPSLADLLAVAPSWRLPFAKVLETIEGRDARIQALSAGCLELRQTSALQKEAVAEATDQLSRLDMELQAIDATATAQYEQPLKKLSKQVATLQQNHRRTVQAKQPLVVPQGDYLRCLANFSRRFQKLATTATDLQVEIEALEVQSARRPVEVGPTELQDIKSVLALQLEQYKQIKFRSAAFHDELLRIKRS